MTPTELETMLESFTHRCVLVVGDTISDVNVYCKVRGVSAETPTMVLEVVETKVSDGGAACVARNLQALGANVIFMTNASSFPEKRRFWVGDHKLLQVDKLPDCLDLGTSREFERGYKQADTVVVADYRHGFINETLATFIVAAADKPLFVASQVSNEESNHHWYDSISTNFIFNEHENNSVDRHSFQSHNWIVTLGAEGSLDHYANSYAGDLQKAIPITPIDTCGAGDAFLAAYALTEDLVFSNIWAGLSCLAKGANPPTIDMLRDWVNMHQ